MQFFTAVLPYVIRFVLFTNFKTIVFWLPLNVLKSSDIKNKNRIDNRGDPCKMPIGVSIGLLSYPLNIILVVRPVKKAWTKLTI